jgi:hypothetical protein
MPNGIEVQGGMRSMLPESPGSVDPRARGIIRLSKVVSRGELFQKLKDTELH